jgi:hypothetical protein
MAITRVQEKGGAVSDATSISVAFDSDVTAGNLLIVGVMKLRDETTSTDFISGDLTKSAGTATIGTPVLDKNESFNFSGGYHWFRGGIWSVPVTGSGSLTLEVDLSDSGSYAIMVINEVAGADIGSGRLYDAKSETGNNQSPTCSEVVIPAGGYGLAILGFYSESSFELTNDWDLVYERDNSFAPDFTGGAIAELTSTELVDTPYWAGVPQNYWLAVGATYSPAGGTSTTPLSANLADSLIYG